MLSEIQIKDIYQSVARQPFILSVTFHKILTNALCTTSRIKNHDTLKCFACGKGRDDLYHYLRCPCVASILKLPNVFGSLRKTYFSPIVLARLSVFFEAYYLMCRQYGFSIFKDNFAVVARKASYLARHVAIKDRIQFLAQLTNISYAQVCRFRDTRKHISTHGPFDIALM